MKNTAQSHFRILMSLAFSLVCSLVIAQDISTVFKDFDYRFLGPYRGGRTTAVAGIANQPHVFFMGSTGGGVWKTDDAGHSWQNVSDGQIKCGSIGSIAVHPKYTDIMYVGTGSDSPRGNISAGIGIYRSDDGGDSWQHKGLKNAGQIGDVVFHPEQPEIAYAAALGNIFGKNKERGVFKTTDGGESWEHAFFLNDSTGCVDLDIHPRNPNILYACMWRAERKPYTLIDGSDTGGLYKSTDGGKSWDRVENGLPKGVLGKMGVSISRANPNIIYVIVETAIEKDGGVYKSTDGGKSFYHINGAHKLRQRAWYYTRIFADPVDEHTVYVTNTGFYRSVNGGKDFDQRLWVPHGDCHDVWINPENPNIIISSNDGGATVSLNKGRTWSTPYNQPTAELYRISTDNAFPFRVYAGQQDNTSISVSSRRQRIIHPKMDWREAGGGESADVAVHPSNPDILYGTSYSGIITRENRETGERKMVGAYPHYTEGTAMKDLKYRWQWNFPIRFSQHNDQVLYHTSNYVHKSTNEGQSWELISPDLSRNIATYQQSIPGGPVQHDATGVEVYSTIFSFEESPHNPLELWAGSDDGRLHKTTNGGESWTEITPISMPHEGTINHIELSKHDQKEAFVVVYNYRYADFKPYIYKTTNGGQSWTKITQGIPSNHFVRALAQDTENPQLLFAGTEFGIYCSVNGGQTWQPLQNNLPHTPITDMEVKNNALVMSTQGRGFWIMDDLTPLRNWSIAISKKDFYLFDVPTTYKTNAGRSGGEHAPPSAYYDVTYYVWAKDSTQNITMNILSGGDTLYTGKRTVEKAGLSTFHWNMRQKAPFMVRNLVMMDMRYPGSGPTIPPGKYTLVVQQGDQLEQQDFEIKPDPNWSATQSDYNKQYALAKDVAGLIDKSQKQLQHLRDIRKKANMLAKEKKVDSALKAELSKLGKKAKELEDMIFQDKIITSQDEINYERLFTNHLIRLYRVVLSQYGEPTAGEYERWQDLQLEYKPFETAYNAFITSEVANTTKKVEALNLSPMPELMD